MRKVKTSELIGQDLDVALAISQFGGCEDWDGTLDGVDSVSDLGGKKYNPSTDLEQGGSIIEQDGIAVRQHASGKWFAMLSSDLGDAESARWTLYTFKGVPNTASTSRQCRFEGPTLLIAGLRCSVASRLGETVEFAEGLS